MNERSDSPFRIRDLLGDVGRRVGIPAAVETGMVWSRWSEIVGEAVAGHAEPSSLKGGVLRVRADSPSWATEIGYLGDEIKASVNRTVGVNLVGEVRVWTGPGSRRTGTGSGAKPKSATRAGEPPAVAPAPDPSAALERARAAWARHAGQGRKPGSRRHPGPPNGTV
jgi:Dna[CI] antecedent, DciA